MEENNISQQHVCATVTTDIVVVGFDGKRLNILLMEREHAPYKGMWALPGGFLEGEENSNQCAKRVLEEKLGEKDAYLEQFQAFTDAARDPRERVVSIAYIALVSKNKFKSLQKNATTEAGWFGLDDLPPLAFDHDKIVRAARKILQYKLILSAVVFKLLDEKFTFRELQRIYEIVNDTTYDRRNFHRKVMSMDIVKPCDEQRNPNNPRAVIKYVVNKDMLGRTPAPFLFT